MPMQYACKTARRVIQLKYAIHSHTHTQSHSHSYSFACLGSGIIIRSTLSILRSLQMPIIFSFSVIIYQVNACTWHGYFRSTYCSPSHSLSLSPAVSVTVAPHWCIQYIIAFGLVYQFFIVHHLDMCTNFHCSLSLVDNFVGGQRQQKIISIMYPFRVPWSFQE